MTPDRFIAAAFRELTAPEPDGGKVVGVSVQLVMDRAAELARDSVGAVDSREVARAALAAYDNWAMKNMRAADDDDGIDAAARVIESASRSAGGDVCTWTLDENEYHTIWETACGLAWSFIDGGPEDNNARFCHGCGKPMALAGVSEGKK